MLNTLELYQWEAFDYASFSLHPGVNVITGLSHKGKSSVIRSFDWLSNNRPTGTTYFPRKKKKPETTVSVETDDTFAVRYRSKKANYYETEDGQYTALRSEVPVQVSDLLNMSNVNLQLQKDVHYMLTESPGKRAKMLNEVVGLEDMDQVQDKANTRYRTVKGQYDKETEELDNLEKKLKGLDWVNDAKKIQDEIDSIADEKALLVPQIANITGLLSQLLGVDQEIKRLPDTTPLAEVEALLDLDDEIYDYEKGIKKIETSLNALRSIENELSNITLPTEDEISDLDTITAQIKEKERQVSNIESLLDEFKYIESRISVADKEVKKLKRKEAEFMEQFDICPFCGGEM